MLILDLLYFLLLLLSWPFWLTYVLKKPYRSLLRSRLRPQLDPAAEKAVWIHAVSVGEVRSLRSLIETLAQAASASSCRSPRRPAMSSPAANTRACR